MSVLERSRCHRGKPVTVRSDGAIEIPLTQGQVAIVDADGYSRICDHTWYAQWVPTTRSFRAVRMTRREVGERDTIEYMHRVIMSVTDAKLDVDHINHDTLDNRRANLRVAPRRHNASNQRKTSGSSRFKGVSFSKNERKWRAQITAGYVNHPLGTFSNEEMAARAYDVAAIRLHGEFAYTNAMMGLL